MHGTSVGLLVAAATDQMRCALGRTNFSSRRFCTTYLIQAKENLTNLMKITWASRRARRMSEDEFN